MSNHCECCGVKFDGEVVDNSLCYSIKTENYKWAKSDTNPCSGRICYWCACKLPGDLTLIAIGVDTTYTIYTNSVVYNKDNFRTFPYLEVRIKQLGLIANKQDDSRWNCKCKNCGAPAYQGLLRIECSNTSCSEKKK